MRFGAPAYQARHPHDMTIFALPDECVAFPDPELADPDGLLAVGGDLSLPRLVSAYSRGIFPWYSEQTPILWWSPDPRPVLCPRELHVPRSLERVLRKGVFRITMDQAFPEVMRACATAPRPQGEGTWIVEEMVRAYTDLHRAGLAHSVEAWQEGRLVGGLYGVALGRAFFGESMFHLVPDASKVAFVTLVRRLATWGFAFVDCQQTTPHMLRFGAQEWPRSRFLRELAAALVPPLPCQGRPGSWREASDFGSPEVIAPVR